MFKITIFNKKYIFVISFIALFFLGVYKTSTYANPDSGMVMPAPHVSVKKITLENVHIWSEFSGRMQAVDYAEIRPEVSGRIVDVRVVDGQTVKVGDILCVIDPEPYKARVNQADAALKIAKLKATLAQTELMRADTMIKTAAISKSLYDARHNEARITNADVLVAEAYLKQENINLARAYIKAPIAGRISRIELTVGNSVQAGAGSPLLTSIVSSNDIYADFDIDEQTYMSNIRKNATTLTEEQQIPVELTVLNDDNHPYKGKIHSFDNRINSVSGTIRARAKFSNKDGRLIPGMFVSVKVGSSTHNSALLVPERAVGSDQNKKFVYIVGSDKKVTYREVTLGDMVEGQRVVLSGIVQGDAVIVDGLQHIRPDMIVDAKEI
jgi:membrane fusion protein, multidrug efflux system